MGYITVLNNTIESYVSGKVYISLIIDILADGDIKISLKKEVVLDGNRSDGPRSKFASCGRWAKDRTTSPPTTGEKYAYKEYASRGST